MSPTASGGDGVSELVAVYPEKSFDVSEYQGRVSWRDVRKAGYRTAFAKASEGISERDREVENNARHAHEAGVRLGLYHYAHPSESPRRNARHFLDVISPLVHVGDPAPLLDLEVTEGHSPESLWRWQHVFCSIVAEALQTVPMLYTYLSFLEHDLYLPPKHRPIFGADYGHVPASVLAGWHGWQYSSSGRVPGVSGRVDLDSIRKPLPTIGRKP